MKNKVFGGIMLLVAAMIFSAGGTCFAQETVFIDTGSSGTTRVFYGPVFSTGPNSGASAYGLIGDPSWVTDPSAATPFAIARKIKDAAGNMNLVWAADGLAPDFSGSTPTGSPAVISGETNAFVVAVQSNFATQVDEFGRANAARTGVTVVMMDGGTMTANWKRGIPEAAVGTAFDIMNPAIPYYPTELTVWTPKNKLNATGATIYGTSTAQAAVSGASVWALTNWGDIAGGGTWDAGAGTTAWPVLGSTYSFTGSNDNILVAGAGRTLAPINGFVASPVISGSSVFYVGHDAAVTGGITVYQLHKDNLGGGVIYAATVKPTTVAGAGFSDRFMPTPVVSGGSLFVVCNQGGVTVYDTQDLAIGGGRTAGYIGNILLPQGATNTGVTASPVVYPKDSRKKDPYIIMCGTSAVTCYKISDGLASNERQWWYDFGANIGGGSQIWGTPAVAGGYVFVPVVDSIGGDGTIYAFKINKTPDMANGQLNFSDQYNLNSGAVASPIVVNRELWAFSHGLAPASSAQAMKWNINNLLDKDDVKAHSYWTQFKFDAAKGGDATRVDDEDDWYPDDSSGCFLNTIQ